jgi:hypothetical protein
VHDLPDYMLAEYVRRTAAPSADGGDGMDILEPER